MRNQTNEPPTNPGRFNTTTSTYDQAGRTTGTAGPQGNLTYSFDPSTGRPTTTVLGSATLSSSGYDSSGRLNQVNVAGTTTGETLAYDTNGRQSSQTITSPTVGTTGGAAQTYSAAGRVATQQVYTSGGLQAPQSLTYDAAGRLTQDALPATTYSYSYGTTSGCPQNGAGADTNRTSFTGAGGSTGYCYDNADRLTSTSAVPNGQVTYDGHGNMTAEGPELLSYDSSDQLATEDGPISRNVYERDPLGRPVQVASYPHIQVNGTATGVTTSGSSVTVNRPAGTVAGDTLVVALTATLTNGVTPSGSGWQNILGETTTNFTSWIAWKTATSTDPSSWSFNVNELTGVNIIATIVDYHNTTSTPIDVTANQADAIATTQPLPQVTTNGSDETIVHIVGYGGNVTPTAPAGDTQRAATHSTAVSELMSDRYQPQTGQSAAVSASSSGSATSAAFTIALRTNPAGTTTRLGYTGQTDNAEIVQNTSGTTIGATIPLPGGIKYNNATTGAGYNYSNMHGDTIEMTDAANNHTWTGYSGPYGETPPGVTAPTDTAIAGGSYAYNGNQGKLTQGDLTLMGARPYNPNDGRFLQADPIQGGCANDYTYAFGDPINHPDLSGEGGCHKHHSLLDRILNDVGTAASITSFVLGFADGSSEVIAFGGFALGVFGTGVDLKQCISGSLDNCIAAALGLFGAASGVRALKAGAAGAKFAQSATLATGGALAYLGMAASAPTYSKPSRCK